MRGTDGSPKLGILKGNSPRFKHYIDACKDLGVEFSVIDLLGSRWLHQIKAAPCDGYLARPPANYHEVNSLYMDRLHFLVTELEEKVYPTYAELFLYENKWATYDWLAIHGFPHLETFVSADRDEALEYLRTAEFPLIQKARIGHGSSAVVKISSFAAGKRILNRVFGARAQILSKGHTKRMWKGWIPFRPHGAAQRHYVILQPFVPIRWEWRIVKIANSYFGHRKLLKGDFASGTLRKGWVDPPKELLLLVKAVCDRGGFLSMAMDVLETIDGRYYINELQSLFGSHHESQMYINGVPGRYTYCDGEFHFEEGIFNDHRSYGLRVRHFLDLLGHSPYVTGSHANQVGADCKLPPSGLTTVDHPPSRLLA